MEVEDFFKYSLFKCLKLSFLGQFLIVGQGFGVGAMTPMASLGPPLRGSKIPKWHHFIIL